MTGKLIDVVLDCETYFDDEYSLRKMATSTYIRDDRFKLHGWAMKVNGGKSVWLTDAEFRMLAKTFPWDRTRIIGHNLVFDGSILQWRYGIRPALWADTLGMARAVIGNRVPRFSLDYLAQYIGRKGKVKGAALNDVKGVRNPSTEQMARLGAYACDDVDDTWALYLFMLPDFPEAEDWVLDWSVRMFTEPKLLLDYDLLAALHEEELTRKQELFDSLPYDKKQLSSNPQFAEILRDLGYEPPVKVSKTTNKETFAFSKSDLAFQALLEDADDFTKLVIEARLAAKSTITETRSLRFRNLAKEGAWAVPLNYAGAKQTKRFSGGQKQNPQNLSARGPGARIRKAIYAPKGYVIYVIDSSNIELRTNAAMAGQWDVIDRLVAKIDEYATFAGKIYQRKIDKEKDKRERNVGKVAVLSLGYQSGAGTYRGMLKAQAGILMDMDECVEVVRLYRKTYPRIAQLWKEHDKRVKMLARGQVPPPTDTDPPFDWFVDDGDEYPTGGVVSRYSGTKVEWIDLQYRELIKDGKPKNALTCARNGTGWTSIYGGKVTENLSQFMAREVVNWQTKRIFDATGFRPQLQVHDELVYVIPASIAHEFDAVAMDRMSGEVPWWPGLITAAESAIVECYGDAK